MKKAKLLSSVLVILLILSCSKENTRKSEIHSNSNHPSTSSPNKSSTTSNFYIVVFNTTATEKINGFSISAMTTKVSDLLTSHGISINKVKYMYETVLFGFAAELSQAEYQSLSMDIDVNYIEQDQIFSYPSSKPISLNSPNKSKTNQNPPEVVPSNVVRVGGGINTAMFGGNKRAWIIDSGIDLDHPDLNVDVSRSISFDPVVTSPDDNLGHGTRVAGILGAKQNGIGVVGVYPDVSLVAVKAGDQTAHTMAIAAAVNHVAANASPGDVVNMSVGDPNGINTSIDDAVIGLAGKGIIVAAAAGDRGSDAANYSPAGVNVANFYTVSGMDENDMFLSSSNWGSSIDYCAPAANIYTTTVGGGYDTIPLTGSGTSWAAPHVAGVMLYPQTTVLNPAYVQNDPDGSGDEIIQVGIQR